MKILELKQNIFKENEVTADKIREEFKKQKKLMINVMSSPGSGKTTTLLRTIERLQDTTRIGVMECDIDASVDAVTIENGGAKAIQLHTGGMCHMDAAMTQQGLNEMGVDDVDLIFIENVGNLVCPAEFDTGASINITILSVPEGDDKPAKYPLVYTVSDVVLINKIDTLPVFDFNKELVEQRIHELNPNAQIFYISSKKDEGFEPWINYLKEKISEIGNSSFDVSQEIVNKHETSKELQTKLGETSVEEAIEKQNNSNQLENGVTTTENNATNNSLKENKYISIYNQETEDYEIYNEEELLDTSKEEVVSENEKIKANNLSEYYASEGESRNSKMGIVWIVISIIGVGIILIILKKNLKKKA